MKRIVSDPQILHGKAYIEGTRVPVHIVLDLLAAGETHQNILHAYPQLEEADILACIQYAATIISEEVVLNSNAG